MSELLEAVPTQRWAIPESWSWTIASEIAQIIGGGTPSTTDPKNFEGGEIPWITPADLTGFREKRIRRGERNITEKGLRDSGARLMPAGTVLFSSRAPIGHVAIADNPLATNQGFKSLVPSDAVTSDYLYYYMQLAKPIAKEMASGTTFLEISGSKAAQIPIPVAPLREQNEIVAEIEKQFTRLDAATAALKRVQANLKRYRASVLKAACEGRLVPTEAELARKEGRDYEPAGELLQRILRERRARWEADTLVKMTAAGKRPTDDRWKQKYKEPSAPDTTNLPDLPEGWCWASLGQLSEIQGGIQKQPSRLPRRNRYPFLRVANVLRGQLDLQDIHEIELFEGELDRLRLKEGDLLIVEGNGSPSEIGRMAAWLGEIQDCVHQNHIIRARPLPGTSSQFLMQFWNSPAGASQVLDVASSTSGLHTLSVGKISKLAVPLPPEAEQKRIAQRADQSLLILARTQEAIRKQNERAASVRQSILRVAFTGQLVPQDPSDEPASVLLERIRAERVRSGERRAIYGPKMRRKM